ncbi:hypothetical protein M6B38_295340 [Iris pallida]|uniref:Uncharacterized protein n=1 Tax=Iris pallida TaxID=29817 RepID=A0AAX6HU15_IRIPA|nr:hypothetical protein M6B38_295340 [Iris pallida]
MSIFFLIHLLVHVLLSLILCCDLLELLCTLLYFLIGSLITSETDRLAYPKYYGLQGDPASELNPDAQQDLDYVPEL